MPIFGLGKVMLRLEDSKMDCNILGYTAGAKIFKKGT